MAKYNKQLKITPELFTETNWANHLDDQDLARLASDLLSAIAIDEESRSEWLKCTEEWTALAMQVKEHKSFPWQNSSNVKFPLLTTASMQFHARSQQALLKGNKPLKAKMLGPDPTGEKAARGDRVEKFMSYILLHGMEDWQDDVDRLLLVLPITGMAFKKVYYSESKGQPRSELVLPHELILNYHATDFGRARRTHVMTRYHNEVVEMQRAGFFRDIELIKPGDEGTDTTIAPQERELYESHCWWDLDDDGYDEPYVVFIDKLTEQVLRISPRFDPEGISYTPNGDIQKILPIEFFSRFVFLPSADSKLYGVGLGTLLGPTNMTVNTLINQLVDAGTLAVLPSGFLGRGARVARGGTYRFGPGEWKNLQSTGDDLRKNIFPLPVKEPSNVLFQLLGMLIESGKQIGSVADIMLGESPGQNQPFSTTQAVLEQGMKVFVGIYKRVYRGMAKEYRMIMDILAEYAPEDYMQFNDQEVDLKADFAAEGLDIVPVSDPDMVSEQQRLLRAESLAQKMAMGLPLNVTEVTKRILEAEDHENIEALMDVPPPEPPPDIKFKMIELEAMMTLEYDKMDKEMPQNIVKMLKDYAQAQVNFAKAQDVADARELEAQRDAASTYIDRLRVDTEKLKAENANKPKSNGTAN